VTRLSESVLCSRRCFFSTTIPRTASFRRGSCCQYTWRALLFIHNAELRAVSPRTSGLNKYQGIVGSDWWDDREVREMKGITILALLLLSGCGTFTTLEQLEATAMLTGDWSEVEKRERTIQRRKLRAGSQCPPGAIAYCHSYMSNNRCTCVKSEVIHSLLGGR